MKLYWYGCIACLALPLLAAPAPLPLGAYAPPTPPRMFGLYYFTMPEQNRDLAYYTSTSPTGPWQYRGIFMPRDGEQNNHHSIVQYQGQRLLFYHQWLDTPGCARKQRHVAVEMLKFGADGSIKPLERTKTGLAVAAGQR